MTHWIVQLYVSWILVLYGSFGLNLKLLGTYSPTWHWVSLFWTKKYNYLSAQSVWQKKKKGNIFPYRGRLWSKYISCGNHAAFDAICLAKVLFQEGCFWLLEWLWKYGSTCNLQADNFISYVWFRIQIHMFKKKLKLWRLPKVEDSMER